MVIIKNIRKKAAFYHIMIAIVMLCGFLFTDSGYVLAGSGKNVNLYAVGSGKTAGISNSAGGVDRPETAEDSSDSEDGQKYIESERIGIIYTGDSRIRRLNLTINMKGMKDTWVVCKSGMGYNWFVSEGIPQIDRLMKEKKYIDKWVIISGWGVNDLWNCGTYINKYTSLMKGRWSKCDLRLMSVNPVDGAMKSKYGAIPSFNSRIKSYVKKAGKNVFYIDTNRVMMSKGFSTIDGLHYTESTNRIIYKAIYDEIQQAYASVNYKCIEINVNSQRTLTLDNYEGRVKWKSSDSNILKIVSAGGTNNKSVTVKALNPGTASVKASFGGREASCEVKVTDNRVMVAYFSYSGETETAAEYIQRRVGGNLVWIDINDVYPYTEKKLAAAAKRELESDARPPLDSDTYAGVGDMSQYDTVYLGFPLWYGFAPRAVCTFIESFNMDGKTVKPFVITQGNDDCSGGVAEIKSLIPNAVVGEPFALDREKVLTKKAKKEIKKTFAY